MPGADGVTPGGGDGHSGRQGSANSGSGDER